MKINRCPLLAVFLTLIICPTVFALPPYFTNCPGGFSGYNASYTFVANEDPANLPYSFNLLCPGVLTAIGDYSVVWTFEADPTVYGDLIPAVFTVAGSEDPELLDSCVSSIIVHYDHCGDANGNSSFNILDITYMIACLYGGGYCFENDYLADVNCDGQVNIMDITRIIMFVYQIEGWMPLQCCNVRDDYPIKIGSWWQYQRYDHTTEIYDTVMVSVFRWNQMEYLYADSADTVTVEFQSPDKIIIPGDYLLYSKYDFLMAVNKDWIIEAGWGDGFSYIDTIDAQETIIVPAGEFTDAFRINRKSHWLEKAGDWPTIVQRFEWFKRRVGPVKMFKHAVGPGYFSEETWELIDYNIAY